MDEEQSSKRFAFVDFESHEAALAACKALHEKEVEGCKLYVDRAQTKAERQNILQRRFEQKRTHMAQQMDGKNVYVKNLAPSVDEDSLKSAFAVRASSTPDSWQCSMLLHNAGFMMPEPSRRTLNL